MEEQDWFRREVELYNQRVGKINKTKEEEDKERRQNRFKRISIYLIVAVIYALLCYALQLNNTVSSMLGIIVGTVTSLICINKYGEL